MRLPPKKRRLPISYPARGGREARADRNRGSGFTIQAGAFRERSSAAELVRRLRQELRLDKVGIREGDGWYRVQVNRRRQQAAETVRRKLQEAGIEAIIVGTG
ncbi:MAG: SPOR domain-containing protein [Acidobacteriota bacterium]|nr:SPOR domain-containing protein [Acidobacteriota bacterium]